MSPAAGSDSVEPTMVSCPARRRPRSAPSSPGRWRCGSGGADDDRRAQAVLELLDAALEERLLVSRGLVVGVLAQVTELAGVLDALHDRRPLDRPQTLELRLETRETLGGEMGGRRGRLATR